MYSDSITRGCLLHAPHARTTGTAEHANDRIDTSAASRASRARQVARSVAVPRGTRRLAFAVHQRGQARAGRGGAGRLSTGQQSLPRAVRVCAEARRADGELEAREPLDERGPGQPLGLLRHEREREQSARHDAAVTVVLCCNTYASLQRGRSEHRSCRRGCSMQQIVYPWLQPWPPQNGAMPTGPLKECSTDNPAMLEGKSKTWTAHSSFGSCARKNERICSRTAET